MFEHEGNKFPDPGCQILFGWRKGEWLGSLRAEGRTEKKKRLNMSINHFRVFLSGDITHFKRVVPTCLTVAVDRGSEQHIPFIHELFRVSPRCTEVNKLNPVRFRVVQEIAPVWVSLHKSEMEKLLQT